MSRDLQQAIEHANAGRWSQAQTHAQRVLDLYPHDPSALSVLGAVAMNIGQISDAIPLFERAAARQPKNPFIQFNLGEANRKSESFAKALGFFRRAGALKPDFLEAAVCVADMLRLLGRYDEAAPHYQKLLQRAPSMRSAAFGYALLLLQRAEFVRAIELLTVALKNTPESHPLRAGVFVNLGIAYLNIGRGIEGFEALSQGILAAPGRSEAWWLLANGLRNTRAVPDGEDFSNLLLKLFERSDINPRNLTTAAIAVLQKNPAIAGLLEMVEANPGEVQKTLEAHASAGAELVGHPLFRKMLTAAPVTNASIELLLVQLRRDLLENGLLHPNALVGDFDLLVALARQSFLNEYIHFVSEEEERAIDRLVENLCRGDLGARPQDAGHIALVAAYRSLKDTPLADRLRAATPSGLADVVREQLSEPDQETALRQTLRVLRTPTDAISIAVREQYEESPYPRWTRCSVGSPIPFKAALRQALPHISAERLPDVEQPRALVAGCGTGLEIMKVLNTYRGVSVLAVDLSATSLAYAMRKVAEYGFSSVEYLQADILDLNSLSERFDLIDSFGVVHHMADPAQGLRVLASLLKPDGMLFIGLYSEIARQAIVAARTYITQENYPATVCGIRAFRRHVMTHGAPPNLEYILSPASDFWTTSDCRDLLFHVNEHRFTLPEIGAMFATAGLEFLGVQFGHAADQTRYCAEHPQPDALRDVALLHAYEIAHPEVFGDTYRLWARPISARAS